MRLKNLLNLKIFDAYSPLLPFTATTLLLALVISLWWTLDQREHKLIQERTNIGANDFMNNINVDLISRVNALKRLAKRIEANNTLSEKTFSQDANAFVSDFPGFQAIEWVDKDYKIKWVIPLTGNEILIGLNLQLDKPQLQLLKKAEKSRETILSPSVNLIQGEKGMRIHISVFNNSQTKGFLRGILSTQRWLRDVLKTHNPNLKSAIIASVFINGVIAYQTHREADSGSSKFIAVTNKKIFGQNITVIVQPTKEYVAANRTFTPQITLYAGSIFALLIGVISYLLQRNAKENRRLNKMKEAFAKTTKSLTLATQAGHAGIWTWNIQTDELQWNDLMYIIYDITKETSKLEYSTWRNRVHPDDIEFTEKLLFAAATGSAKFETTFRIINSHNQIRYISAAAQVEHDEGGNATIMTGVNMDITDQTQAQIELAEEKEKLASIIEGTNVGTWEWNIQTGEVKFNEKWASIIGYSLEELSPLSINTWQKHAHPDDLQQSNELLEKHFSGELPYYDYEARMKHKDGHWVWVHDRGRVSTWTHDGKPLLMFGTHQDISQRKANEEKIKHLANHDPLTGLPTRRLAEDRLTIAIATAKRERKKVGVLFIDLDGFKPINDKYGHKAGDELLQEVGKVLTTCLRDNDTVARIGGDEFLIILPKVNSSQDIERVAIKIIEFLSHPIYLNEGVVTIGASIGIAIYPENTEEAGKLIRLADKAMYKIKSKNKNSYAFY